jgi:hypothetical protein
LGSGFEPAPPRAGVEKGLVFVGGMVACAGTLSVMLAAGGMVALLMKNY